MPLVKEGFSGWGKLSRVLERSFFLGVRVFFFLGEKEQRGKAKGRGNFFSGFLAILGEKDKKGKKRK